MSEQHCEILAMTLDLWSPAGTQYDATMLTITEFDNTSMLSIYYVTVHFCVVPFTVAGHKFDQPFQQIPCAVETGDLCNTMCNQAKHLC